MGKLVKGMMWGSAIGVTAVAAAISMAEPRVARVVTRKGRHAARIVKRKINSMM